MIQRLKNIDVYIPILFIFTLLMGSLIFYRVLESPFFYISSIGDIKEQYIHFFNLFHDLVRSGEMPFWSWSYGPGGSFWNEFGYYMLGDIFIWPLLLFPTEWFPHSFVPVSMLKLSLMALGMYVFLKELEIRRPISFLAGIAYSFAILYFEYFYSHYFFVNAAVFFPFILFGYEKYLKTKNSLVLILFLFLAGISNFYFLFMITLGLAIYSVFRFFAQTIYPRGAKGFFVFHLKLSGVYLLGLGLSMVIFLPSAFGLFQSNLFVRPDTLDFQPWLTFEETISKLMWDGGMNFLPFITIPILFINGKRNFWYGLMGIFLLILIMFQQANSIVGGLSSPHEFRGFFVFNTLFIMLAAISLDKVDFREVKNPLLLAILAVSMYFWLELHPFTHYDEYLKWMPVLFSAAFILYSYIKNKYIKRVFFASALAFVSVFSMLNPWSLVTDLLAKSSGEQSTEAHKGVWGTLPLMTEEGYETLYQNAEVEKALEYLEEEEFYRLTMNYPGITAHNSSMTYGYHSFYAYNSLIKWNLQEFEMDYLAQLGGRGLNLLRGYPNSTIMNTLLSNKYYVSFNGSRTNLYGYEDIVAEDDLIVQESQNWLPIGFLYEHAITEQDLNNAEFSSQEEIMLNNAVIPKKAFQESGLTTKKDLTHRIIGELEEAQFNKETKVTAQEEGLLVESEQPIVLTIPLAPHDLGELSLYAEFQPYTETEGITIKAEVEDGRAYTMRKNMSGTQYVVTQYSYTGTADRVGIRFGQDLSSKEMKVTILPGKFLLKKLQATLGNYNDYESSVKELQAHPLREVTVENNVVKGKIEADRASILYLSIPYSKGWQAYLDGEKVDTFPVHTAFTGISVKEGMHEVTLRYTPEGFAIGAAVSTASLAGIVLLLLRRNKARLSKKELD
ncbi:YfhO family protein [Rossellomorea oryzaecorticis]|uniref:YfhO family protein n=1 Tax=Rossellomorea oryzaecorticis TaxID=1396505 RepID=A0ABU9K491_9BACI